MLTEAAIAIRVAVIGGLPLYHDATRALLDREGFEVAINGSADVVLVDQDDANPSIRDDSRAIRRRARARVVTAAHGSRVERATRARRRARHRQQGTDGRHTSSTAIRKVHARRDVGGPRGRHDAHRRPAAAAAVAQRCRSRAHRIADARASATWSISSARGSRTRRSRSGSSISDNTGAPSPDVDLREARRHRRLSLVVYAYQAQSGLTRLRSRRRT